jgi:hypothetical protein
MASFPISQPQTPAWYIKASEASTSQHGFGRQEAAPTSSPAAHMLPNTPMASEDDFALMGAGFEQMQQPHTAYPQIVDLTFHRPPQPGAPQESAEDAFHGVMPSNAFSQQPQQLRSESDDIIYSLQSSSASASLATPGPEQQRAQAKKTASKKAPKKRDSFKGPDPRKKPDPQLDPTIKMAPGQRAKTVDQKRQRELEKVKRNRVSTDKSREKKKCEFERLQNRGIELENENARLRDQLANLGEVPETGNSALPTQPTAAQYPAPSQEMDTCNYSASAYASPGVDVEQGPRCSHSCINCRRTMSICSSAGLNEPDGQCTACRAAGVLCEKLISHPAPDGGSRMTTRVIYGHLVHMHIRSHNGVQVRSSDGQGSQVVGIFQKQNVYHQYSGGSLTRTVQQKPIVGHPGQRMYQYDSPAQPQTPRRQASLQAGTSVYPPIDDVPQTPGYAQGSTSTEDASGTELGRRLREANSSSNTALNYSPRDPTAAPEPSSEFDAFTDYGAYTEPGDS